jgi:hypothetical protein
VALAERSRELLDGLPRDWRTATIDVTIEDESQADRAAVILAPATPGRVGNRFRIFVHNVRAGGEVSGPTPELVRRVLARLDGEGIAARVRLVDVSRAEAVPAETPERSRFTAEWDRLVERLPPDWSDLLVEVSIDSSDYLELAALLLAPVNPSRTSAGRLAYRFRVARRDGYGAAPQMARRCLERLDEAGITGRVRILQVLSDTHHVSTQGPVWRIGGRAV